MKHRFNISAAQLALRSGFGAVVSSSGFFLTFFDSRFFPRTSAAFIPSLFLSFALVIAGFVISTRSESSLENGIAAERWPEEKIAALRCLMRSPLWKVLSVVCTVVCLIACVAGFIAVASSPYRGLFWVGFIFSMTIYRLHAAVLPRPSIGPPKTIDWNNGSPLQSQHWGEH